MFWIFLSICALLCYGGWGVFNGMAARTNVDPLLLVFFSSIGYLVVGLIALTIGNFDLNSVPIKGVIYAMCVGLATGLGGLFLLMSMQQGGTVSIVVALTATYPLMTLIINYAIFNGLLNIRQICGMMLSVIAVILMTI